MLCSELLKHINYLGNKYPKMMNRRCYVQYSGSYEYINSIKLKGLNYLIARFSPLFPTSSILENNLTEIIPLLEKYPIKKLLFSNERLSFDSIKYVGIHEYGNLIISLDNRLTSDMKELIKI